MLFGQAQLLPQDFFFRFRKKRITVRPTTARAAGVCQSMRSGEAEEFADLEDGEGGEVGEEAHGAELAEGPFPGAGFPFHDGSGGEALEGVDEEDDERNGDKRGENGGAVGLFGIADTVAEVFDLFFIGRVGDGEGGIKDLAGGEGGEHGGSHAGVPSEGFDKGFDEFSGLSHDRVLLLDDGIFGFTFGVGVEEPEKNADAENESAGLF